MAMSDFRKGLFIGLGIGAAFVVVGLLTKAL
jgi:hypothetical protein